MVHHPFPGYCRSLDIPGARFRFFVSLFLRSYRSFPFCPVFVFFLLIRWLNGGSVKLWAGTSPLQSLLFPACWVPLFEIGPNLKSHGDENADFVFLRAAPSPPVQRFFPTRSFCSFRDFLPMLSLRLVVAGTVRQLKFPRHYRTPSFFFDEGGH